MVTFSRSFLSFAFEKEELEMLGVLSAFSRLSRMALTVEYS